MKAQVPDVWIGVVPVKEDLIGEFGLFENEGQGLTQ
jgi:hypothetical protein